MKKSVKEQLEELLVMVALFGVTVRSRRAMFRLLRRACNEAKQAGLQAGWQCCEDAFVLGGEKKASALANQIASERVSEIINGPKKGKRK